MEQTKTIKVSDPMMNGMAAQVVTIFDGDQLPLHINLDTLRAGSVTFGRQEDNSIQLISSVVSRRHGSFEKINGQWWIVDAGSTNGLICNDALVHQRMLIDGDIIRIDSSLRVSPKGVLIVVSSNQDSYQWRSVPAYDEISIGRSPDCSITLSHISVSRTHAFIRRDQEGWLIIDANSTNGVLVNGARVKGSARLFEKDVITIANARMIFTSRMIYYYDACGNGISIEAQDVVVRRGRGRKAFITTNHVSLNIKPSELIAIIGGSGAGKSTILNALSGYLPPASGRVYINGSDLYLNFDSIKKLIGYVPQSDIVYDNLTLYDMLKYTAKLRLPEDTTPEEAEDAIATAIATVELTEKRNSPIRSLSGGQRKRASIAVELLSDPNILFLDEPASGLDPGTERNLMHSLRQMADSGKTVVLVTHSTLQLQLCDKIVFMGRGGNLCFFGSYQEALRFFQVDDIVDVYNKITDDAETWRDRYAAMVSQPPREYDEQHKPEGSEKKPRLRQLRVLCARYFKLVINDRQRLLLLMLQAPLLALLISFVANDQQFKQYEMTKSLLFALSCSGFWIGMLNAIQEICKERTILRREYMTGLSLSAYVASKLVVLSALCMVQSLLVVLVFSALVGAPEQGLIFGPGFEMYITTCLTAISATAMGLFVSSLFTNADRAMTVAPILLMPQILFSGLIFTLSGATEIISWFAICRWSMEGYGSTANLNDLPLRLQQEGLPLVHEAEDFFRFTGGHLFASWLILMLFVAVFIVGARLVLSRIGKDGR